MRTLWVLLLLAVCSAANAGLSIQFTPGDDPVHPGDTVSLSIVAQDIAADVFLNIHIQGPVSVSLVNFYNIVNPILPPDPIIIDDPLNEWLAGADLFLPEFPTPQMPNGVVIGGIELLFGNPGTVEVVIFDPASVSHGGASYEYDRQTLTVVPEPVTVALFALGGLAIRRRIA